MLSRFCQASPPLRMLSFKYGGCDLGWRIMDGQNKGSPDQYRGAIVHSAPSKQSALGHVSLTVHFSAVRGHLGGSLYFAYFAHHAHADILPGEPWPSTRANRLARSRSARMIRHPEIRWLSS